MKHDICCYCQFTLLKKQDYFHGKLKSHQQLNTIKKEKKIIERISFTDSRIKYILGRQVFTNFPQKCEIRESQPTLFCYKESAKNSFFHFRSFNK